MVNFDNSIKRGHPILFGLILFFSIIDACIATWLVAKYNSHHNYPSHSVRDRTRYLLFTGWWSVLFTAIFMGLFLSAGTAGNILTSIGSHFIFLFITWVFWLAGAASITSALGGGHDCSSISYNLPYCNQLNAVMGFAWIVWILMTFALFVVIFRGIFATRRGDGLKGSLA